MSEDFLQYIWQHQLLEGNLTTTEGASVVVERAGDLNRDAGPDFTNARLIIGGVSWVGNIEVHVRASDWNVHKHSANKAYDNVILHVVFEHDTDVSTHSGSVLPSLELKRYLPENIWRNYNVLLNPTSDSVMPCGGKVGNVSDMVFNAYLERMAVERIQRKNDEVSRLLSESHGSWEQCCYWLMARSLGGKVNGFAFELLAKCTDIRLLARWKDNPQRTEALLMGQAGLLKGVFVDDYPRSLQADYEAIRAGSGLKSMDGSLWRSFRLRPSSFPTIRISQFARFVSQSSHIFTTLLNCTDAKEISALFNVAAADYWTDHYQFDVPSKPSPKRIGKSQADTIVINAWVPLLFQYGCATGQQRYKEQALDLLNQLPSEDNRIVRIWSSVGRQSQSALQSQALLELYNQYCHNRRCLACQIGYRFIKSK
ncbi:MAG: DUF2851 family protein [Bacteroidales bacterium]|nr:DUF2851 family protein [Bacteroidales bacterium]